MLPQAVLAGRVLDEEGEPVQGAQIQVLNRRMQQGLANWIGMRGNATNDLGEFRIAGVQPGRVLLQITPPGMRRGAPPVSGQVQEGPARSYVSTFYPGVLDPSQAMAIDVKPGMELTNLDIALRKTDVYRIRGRALDVNGEPLQRFIVTATRLDRAGAGPAGFTGSPRQDGTFEVANLPPGDYRVMVRRLAGGPQNQAMVTEMVALGSTDVEGLVVQVNPGFAVGGRVVVEGQPATPVSTRTLRVSLLPAEQGMIMLGTRPGIPAEDGSFKLEGVAPGKYRVAPATAAGVYLADVLIGGQSYFGKEIDLTGGVPGPIQIVYRTDGAVVTGTVEVSDSKPVTPPVAVIVPADPELRAAIQPRQANVDESGAFQFDNLRPGEYLLWVFDDADLNELSDPDFLLTVQERAVKVRAKAAESVPVKAVLAAWPLEY
ncbi:MAG: carboxypeptidase-like regulatory domain-containing protein [Bryobacteraceae bacterium]|nr:carboxypeptidase-like regulatory domain-containing protein [Bryobacteraceae bacterium]